MGVALSVRLPDKLAKELNDIALATERSKSFLVQKTLESYLRDSAASSLLLQRKGCTSTSSKVTVEVTTWKSPLSIASKKSLTVSM